MLAANGIHHNGHSLTCTSDYPPVTLDGIAPQSWRPQPKWHDAFPVFTHNLNWIDRDGASHSLTIRADSLPELMEQLKVVKSYIKAGKEQYAVSQPQKETSADVQPCLVHHTDMVRRYSKRTGGHYFAHKLSSIC